MGCKLATNWLVGEPANWSAQPRRKVAGGLLVREQQLLHRRGDLIPLLEPRGDQFARVRRDQCELRGRLVAGRSSTAADTSAVPWP